MLILYKNDAGSKLAAGITSVQTTLPLTAGHGAKFPQPVAGQSAFYVTVEAGNKERMLCTARVGDTLTVTRAQGGTVAAAFALGAVVELRANAELLDSKLSVVPINSTLTIYVSPTGNDTTGTGTQAAPYLTIAKAIDTVRGLATEGGYVNILLADGLYLQIASLDTSTLLGGALYIGTTTSFGTLSTTPTAVSEFGAIRANSIAYTAGKFVIPATPNGFWYECTTGGTSAASPPTFGTTVGGTTVDGTVTWTCRNYHDVTMTHSTVNAPTFIVGRYLRATNSGLHSGTHKVIAFASGSVTYRVYDYAARAIEATPVAGTFYARNVVIATNDGTTVLFSWGNKFASFGAIVIDGTDRALNTYGVEAYARTHYDMGSVSFVNLNTGVAADSGSSVKMADASNCDFGVNAYGNCIVLANTIHGCVEGVSARTGARIICTNSMSCGVGARIKIDGGVEAGTIKNCTTGLILSDRSYASLDNVIGCGTGLTITGGSYAVVTTFTGNTTNSDLVVNTIGNANSYVKN